MSSRREEKERRRRERIAREHAAERAEARLTRVKLVVGGFVVALVVAGAAVAIAGGIGDDDGGARQVSDSDANLPRLPPQRINDLSRAARAAGCTVSHPRYEGAQHEQKDFTAADYASNPPTSGTHFPQWADDGVYEPGNPPPLGMAVHTLEHGRIDIQYRPGAPASTVRKLRALVAEQEGGYHMLLLENQTNMPYEVAATAWTHLLGCERFNDKAIDALRAFRASYIDKGPEQVP